MAWPKKRKRERMWQISCADKAKSEYHCMVKFQRNGLFPAIAVDRGCRIHLWSQWASEPWGNSGIKRIPATQQPPACSHSLRWALRKLRVWKPRILALDSWGAYPRNASVSSYFCVFLYIAWVTWFPSISKNLLMFRLPALCYETST